MRSFLLLILGLLFLGCVTPAETLNKVQNVAEALELPVETTEGPGEPVEEPIEPETTPNQALVESVIASYNESDPSTFDNVNLLLDVDAEDVLPLLDKNDSYSQWTGLYVLSNVGYRSDEKQAIKDALQPYLAGDDAGFRFMAGTTLLAMGDKGGIPVLIDNLGDTEMLLLSEPPMLICTYANEMLVRYTEEDFGYTCSPGDIDHVAKTSWEDWWAQNEGSITWDAAQDRMVIG